MKYKTTAKAMFPSPCGVWVVSMWPTKLLGRCDLVSVPLRGVGCFEADRMEIQGEKLMFPSPCGVWVVSMKKDENGEWITRFRPLAGCGLFRFRSPKASIISVSVPLRGVGCFQESQNDHRNRKCFRPLAGCGLFPESWENLSWSMVSVPLRGVGCFGKSAHSF